MHSSAQPLVRSSFDLGNGYLHISIFHFCSVHQNAKMITHLGSGAKIKVPYAICRTSCRNSHRRKTTDDFMHPKVIETTPKDSWGNPKYKPKSSGKPRYNQKVRRGDPLSRILEPYQPSGKQKNN